MSSGRNLHQPLLPILYSVGAQLTLLSPEMMLHVSLQLGSFGTIDIRRKLCYGSDSNTLEENCVWFALDG